MTTSGVYGFVTGFEGDIAWLEIDDNVQIRIARQAIQRKVDTAKGESAVPSRRRQQGEADQDRRRHRVRRRRQDD
jgi:preprotein translocase subunit YajC